MELKDILNEVFDNYPEIAQNYGEAIRERYEIEVENKKITTEEIDNLKNLYFTKPKNNYIGNEDK